MKKKILSVVLLAAVTIFSLAGCGSNGKTETTEKTSKEVSKEADKGIEKTKFKMAMVSSGLGSEMFNLNAYNAMKELSEKHGFEYTSVECSDTAAWEENITALGQEGYDLIVGVGWNAAEPLAKAQKLYPDSKYAIIDSACENENVTSITFREQEGAYVQGVLLAKAFPDNKLFGYVCSYQTQATYKYRYGFEQGIKSVIPDAKMIYNYVNSYSDTSMVHEYAVQQQAAGCEVVIGGVSSAANSGIYQAALELAKKGTPIYTTGLSVDQTTEENPYILGGLLKNTGDCMTYIIENYMGGTLKPGEICGGLAEDMFGVVYITTESENYRNTDIITDEVIAAAKKAADDIVSGKLVIDVPEETK